MGQKVNPIGVRLLINQTWNSKWFASKKSYSRVFHRDLTLRKTILNILQDCGIARIDIERSVKKVVVHIHTSKPGVVIGSQGSAIDDLKQKLEKKFNDHFEINIKEIKKPELNAVLVGDLIATQISKRIAYRRAAKQSIQRAMEAGAKGIKVLCAGRLNGVEIARSEYFKDGNIPLQTFRADISYTSTAAHTTYGKIGIKVWIYTGEKFKKKKSQKLLG